MFLTRSMRVMNGFRFPDDCISPGYHTSLPLEVHGAGYSDMQMISKNSYKKLMCPTIIVTQITFDLEAFTYYAVNYLCSINNKKYGFFFDCGCEIVKVIAKCKKAFSKKVHAAWIVPNSREIRTGEI